MCQCGCAHILCLYDHTVHRGFWCIRAQLIKSFPFIYLLSLLHFQIKQNKHRNGAQQKHLHHKLLNGIIEHNDIQKDKRTYYSNSKANLTQSSSHQDRNTQAKKREASKQASNQPISQPAIQPASKQATKLPKIAIRGEHVDYLLWVYCAFMDKK